MALPPFTKTLLLAGVTAFLALPRRGGTWLIVLAPLLTVCAVYSAARAVTRPSDRRASLIQLAVWIATLALGMAVQAYWSTAARSAADAAAAAVLAFKERTGSLPATLGEAGLNENELRAAWRLTYRMQGGRAELTYPTQVMPMSTHEFDFESRSWKLNAY